MKKFYIGLLALIFTVNTSAQTAKTQPKARKTVTNADLEKFRVQRQKSDPDDEAERTRRGLPSRAEEESLRESRLRELSETAQKLRQRNKNVEQNWTSQADALRVEFAAIDAEISYLNETLRRFPVSQTYYAVNYIPGVYNFGNFFPPILPPFGINQPPRQDVYVPSRTATNRTTPPPAVFRDSAASSAERRRPRDNFNNNSPNGVLVVPFTVPTQQDVTRENLRERLIALRQTRAGMVARWNALVEQARQDGVNIY